MVYVPDKAAAFALKTGDNTTRKIKNWNLRKLPGNCSSIDFFIK
jgi:hypothetical protein